MLYIIPFCLLSKRNFKMLKKLVIVFVLIFLVEKSQVLAQDFEPILVFSILRSKYILEDLNGKISDKKIKNAVNFLEISTGTRAKISENLYAMPDLYIYLGNSLNLRDNNNIKLYNLSGIRLNLYYKITKLFEVYAGFGYRYSKAKLKYKTSFFKKHKFSPTLQGGLQYNITSIFAIKAFYSLQPLSKYSFCKTENLKVKIKNQEAGIGLKINLDSII